MTVGLDDRAEGALQGVQVEACVELAPDTFVLTLGQCQPFAAGQTIKLTLDRDAPPRIYSLCSGPDDPHHQVLFNIKPDGLLTPAMARLQVGDTIYASAPYGAFVGTDAPAWWIATGTGIAPFRSMVRGGLREGKTLIHGARDAAGFCFADELADALGTRYHRCCSGGTSAGCQDGRVTDYLAQHPALPTDRPYYLCGSEMMVVEVRDLLIARGIPFTRIFSEIYF
jgi:ferredoxin--NADP+ reductase